MKKSNLIRLISMVLVLGMLIACFVACGEPQKPDAGNNNGGENNGGENGGESGDIGEVDITTEEGKYLPEVKNYEYEFMMRAPDQVIYGTSHYAPVDGKGEIIDNALLDRQLLLQDMFGIILTLDTKKNGAGLFGDLGANHSTQKQFSDVLFMEANYSMTAATRGMLWNLNLLEELNLEASYYDQRIQQNFLMDDMLFQITGDYEVLDELVTFGVLYNEFVYNELKYNLTKEEGGYGNIYDVVHNYEWTYDLMMEMAAPFTEEVAGAVNPQDNKWGIVSENQAIYYFYTGSGLQPMRSINGELVLELGTQYPTQHEQTVAILQHLLPFGTNENVLLSVDIVDTGAGKSVIACDIFEENRALFRTTSLSDALYCENMENDFGILPIPQYDSAQRAYYNQINADAAWPLCIPLFVTNVHKTAEIVEVLSYYSRYGGDEPLYEAFFERLSLAKICRKDEDREMLELIFSQKVYCIDTYVSGGVGLRALVLTLVKKGPDTLSSDLDSKLSGVDKSMNNMLIRLRNSNKDQATRYDGTPAA